MTVILEMSLVIFCFMALIFILAQILHDNSIIDVCWGLGFILVAGFSFLTNSGSDIHKVLMNLAVVLWGVRLSAYILLRAIRRGGEDFRYRAWRNTWKHFVLRSFFQIFMLQGVLMLIIALPVYFVNFSRAADTTSINLIDCFAIGLYILGMTMESVGDYQMTVFKKKKDSKGRLMTSGLWRFTRHPNYFGESLIWWGISLFALHYPGGWKTLLSPVLLTLLLRFVSGVPMLEAKYKDHPDWKEYKKRTAAFVPFLKFL